MLQWSKRIIEYSARSDAIINDFFKNALNKISKENHGSINSLEPGLLLQHGINSFHIKWNYEYREIKNKEKESSGRDIIPSTLSRDCICHIISSLTHLNESIERGKFPNKLKINPKFKRKRESNFENHRPLASIPWLQRFLNIVCCKEYCNM